MALFWYQACGSLLRQCFHSLENKRTAGTNRKPVHHSRGISQVSNAKSSVCIGAKKRTLTEVSPSKETLEDTSLAQLGREATSKRPMVPARPSTDSGSSGAAQPRGAGCSGRDTVGAQRDTPAELKHHVLKTACQLYLF